MESLLTTGEMIDMIKQGDYAISQDSVDRGVVISFDDDGWIYIVHPHRKYKRYGIDMKFVDGLAEKRWEIKKIDKYFMSEIEGLEFVD